MRKLKGNIRLTALALIGLALLTLLYRPHFSNGFYFDDWHTIQTNTDVHNWRGIPTYFSDATTFSSLPLNRTYRPMVTAHNALDHHLAGGLHPQYFHLNNFLHYLLLLMGIFLLVHRLARIQHLGKWSGGFALAVAAVFGFNTANAETLNYIISRSDIFAATGVVWAMYAFLHPWTRKRWLFLLPFLYGLFAKQSALMFIPLCFMMQWLFIGRPGPVVKTGFRALRKIAPVLVIGLGVFLINQLVMVPEKTVSFNSHVGHLKYIISQFYALARYVVNFAFAADLNVDPGLSFSEVTSGYRLWLGVLINVLMTAWLWRAIQRKMYLVVLGISWFYISNFPTSLVPFFQITNDHRMFLPSIGMAIAATAELTFWLREQVYQTRALTIIYACLLYVTAHGLGIQNRCEVWSSEVALWEDAVKKRPNNPRAQLSLGWAYLDGGQIDKAEACIVEAFKLHPRDPYGRMAMGLLYAEKGLYKQAERHFKFALTLYPDNPDGHWYYAQFLMDRGRKREAKNMAKKGLNFSKNHSLLLEMVKQK